MINLTATLGNRVRQSMLASVLLILLIAATSISRGADSTTDYFEFHSNYWINLHHFLYQEAFESQERKLEEDGLYLIDIGEQAAIANMPLNDIQMLNIAIAHYRSRFAGKNLRRDLGDVRVWLQTLKPFEEITDTAHSEAFTLLLNAFSPVYERHLWPIHEKHNANVLSQHLENVDRFEEEVILKMEGFSGMTWPKRTKVRVDLTVYANYAGAYTASKPAMNIVISTIDPLNNTSSFEETVFHEGSHLLYLYGESPFRNQIYKRAEELGMDFPNNLWHASMFYLSGRATQDAMKAIDINHRMDMDVRNIFSSYNTEAFREDMERFYLGEVDQNEVIELLLENLK